MSAALLAPAPVTAESAGYAWIGRARMGSTPGSGVINDVWSSSNEAAAGVINNDVWVATNDGIWRIRDGGTPTRFGLAGEQVTQVAARIDEPFEIYAARSGGVYLSTDGGSTWGSSPAVTADQVFDIDVVQTGTYSEVAFIQSSNGWQARNPGNTSGGFVSGSFTRSGCRVLNADSSTTYAVAKDSSIETASRSSTFSLVASNTDALPGVTVHLLECEYGSTYSTVKLTAYSADGIRTSSNTGTSWSGPSGLPGVRWRLAQPGSGTLLSVTPSGVYEGVDVAAPSRSRGLPDGGTIKSAITDVRPSGPIRPYVATTAGLFWMVQDSTAPTSDMVEPSRALSRSVSVPARWTGTDPAGTGILHYDVRRRTAPYNGGFSTSAFRTNTTAKSASYPAAQGSTSCFSARAEDRAGNVSGYSGELCTAVPLDDRSLKRIGSWTEGTGTGLFRGTKLTATAKGATLSVLGARAKTIGILVQVCPTCGKVDVWFDGSKQQSFNLYAPSRQTVGRLVTPAFEAVQRGRIDVVVTSVGKPVVIDGVWVSKL